MTQSVSTPSCFGKQWDPREPECAGGRDPHYVGDDGSQIRPRCDFFQSCGARAEASKQRLVAANSLVRPTQVPVQTTTPAPATPSSWPRYLPPAPIVPSPVRQAPTYIPPPQAPGVYAAPPHTMAYGYQQMMPVNYQMPAYLTVPEPVHPNGSVWSALGREMVRAAFKSVGHTIANFFDHNVFGR